MKKCILNHQWAFLHVFLHSSSLPTYFAEEIPYDQYQTAYHAGYYEQNPVVASQYEGDDNVLNFLSNYAVTEKQSFDDVSI